MDDSIFNIFNSVLTVLDIFFFHFMFTIFLLGVLYPEHLQLAFDFVVIACSLDSIRPGLVQGCKAPNVVG